jgi:aryl-alcohol dehydrogenase-like predicted oxidoreductase
MGVIVKEALANGRLTDRNRDPDFAARRALLAREAERLGATVDALALAAVLAQPWADVVLSGATTVAQLRSNLRALEIALGRGGRDRARRARRASRGLLAPARGAAVELTTPAPGRHAWRTSSARAGARRLRHR